MKSEGFSAVVLAAGAGRRLGELGRRYSKPMVPVLGRPMIDWALERLQAAGAGALTLVAHPENEALLDHIRRRWPDASLVDQPERRGPADAILRYVDSSHADSAFLCCACDSLFPVADIRRVTASPGRVAIGVLAMGLEATRDRSSVVVADDQVTAIVEKPKSPQSPLVGLPIYWLTEDLIPFLRQVPPAGNETYVTTAMAHYLAAGGRIAAVRFAQRLELTSPADLPELEARLRDV